MTAAELQALKNTFPWRKVMTRPPGTIVVLDRNNQIVPMMAMLEFLEVATLKMASKPEEPKTNQESAP